MRFLAVLIISLLLPGCLTTQTTYDWPRATEGADQVLSLDSNVEQTDFYIDGRLLASGRRAKILIDGKGSHTVRAEPPGYRAKEEFIQPPYHSYSTLSFIFMLGDRTRSGETPPASDVKPSEQSDKTSGYNVSFELPQLTQRDQTRAEAVAVIIGNKDYNSYSPDVPNVDFAHNDADLIYQFVTQSLGFKKGNIIFLKDATQAQLLSTFGTLENPNGKLSHWVRAGRSDVFVFYSGHGVPGLKDGQGYLLPVDADPATVEINGYPLDTLYRNLGQLSARSLTIAIDACFSGLSNDGAVIKNASSISLREIKPRAQLKNATLITAAGIAEVASWDKEAHLGLMTRYLVEGLSGQADNGQKGNNDGNVSMSELRSYMQEEVSYQARRQYGREQNPEINGSEQILINVPR